MPTYEYKCNDCQHSFEEFHLMSETVELCVKCSSEKIEKVLGSFTNYRKFNTTQRTKPGDIVKEYIKDVKIDLKTQKRELKKESLK